MSKLQYDWHVNPSGAHVLKVANKIRFEIWRHSKGYDAELFFDNSRTSDCCIGMDYKRCRTAKMACERIIECFGKYYELAQWRTELPMKKDIDDSGGFLPGIVIDKEEMAYYLGSFKNGRFYVPMNRLYGEYEYKKPIKLWKPLVTPIEKMR